MKCLQNYKYVCDFLVGLQHIFSIGILIFDSSTSHTYVLTIAHTIWHTQNYIHTIRYTAIHTQLQTQ